MMPPDSFLWESNQSAAWNVKVPPLGSHSRSWHKYGESIALMLCIQCAWADFLELEGLGDSQCPIEGLMEADFLGMLPEGQAEGGAQGSGGASSSSAGPARP